MSIDFLGVAPFAVVTAGVTWFVGLHSYRDKKRREKLDHDDRLEIHRDDLTFELIQHARGEMSATFAEMKNLREEVKTLRALEQHFFHFQQSLDHLDAVLFATSVEARKAAERSAKAFLKRMRRLNEASGTARNEAQITDSFVRITDDGIEPMESDPHG